MIGGKEEIHNDCGQKSPLPSSFVIFSFFVSLCEVFQNKFRSLGNG
jgi:hypothetical protein